MGVEEKGERVGRGGEKEWVGDGGREGGGRLGGWPAASWL
jgi:hypothetical protein